MSQERWDVVLRLLDGPLSYQGDLVCRGPVVRLGANPGPGGVKLEGYRGLDARQATITAYDGATVSIAPVGSNQVRVATHENVDWTEIQIIRGPVYLSPGGAFHLGPPGRGVSAIFVECRRLGVWEQGRILSDAAQAAPDSQSSDVRELDARRGVPLWFIPAMVSLGLVFFVAILVPIILLVKPPIQPLGPIDEGKEYYDFVDTTVPVAPELLDGLNQPFHDFVMAPNATAADWPELERPKNWDKRFLNYVTHSTDYHRKARAFWKRLDDIESDYAYVVKEMREVGLPEIFAAIPYQESTYHASARSPACAVGFWQMLPEVANRAGVVIRDCRMRGLDGKPWSPTAIVPVRGVMKNAPYIDPTQPDATKCRITGCDVDQRADLAASTRGAIELMKEAWGEALIRDSGAAVQLTILSHNVGLDNAAIDHGSTNYINILPAYKRYLAGTKQARAPDYYGENITCTTQMPGSENYNKLCEGTLAYHAQHYAYNIVAQHFLAVCYYGTNYGSKEPWNTYRDYVKGDGYCTAFDVPTRDALLKGGKG